MSPPPAHRRTLILLILLLFLGAMSWKGYYYWNQPITPQAPGARPAPKLEANRFTMLLLGADDRRGQMGRSDTLLLCFVDLDAGKINLLSIPRDSYVEIPGRGWAKINAAYAYGGEELTRQAVERLIGMPVDHYLVVNMQGFKQIVETVGGVDLTIAENMNYDDPYDTPPLHIHLKKGTQHLSGEQALQYVRFRHDFESDWGRMKRQQVFLQAMAKTAIRPANLTRLPQLIKAAQENVRTTLSFGQVTQLIGLAREKLSSETISGETLSGSDLWAENGAYYLALDFPKMRATVQSLAGITPDEVQKAIDRRDAFTYRSNLPKPRPG